MISIFQESATVISFYGDDKNGVPLGGPERHTDQVMTAIRRLLAPLLTDVPALVARN